MTATEKARATYLAAVKACDDARHRFTVRAKQSKAAREAYLARKTKGRKAAKIKARKIRDARYRAYKRAQAKKYALRARYFYVKNLNPRGKAVAWAKKNTGVNENPAGSNRGGKITTWQLRFGSWLVGQPWCGVFVGNALLAAGVKVNSRIASVAFIEDDARAGRNGFKAWRGPQAGQAGDVAVLFGRGIHTGLIERATSDGYWVREGNTSSGNAGSQSNGGGSYLRFRPFSSVHGVAVPDYPN
jgi:hypothetical protein